MHSDMVPGSSSFQSAEAATNEPPMLVKMIEIAGFAAVAAVGTGLGDIFQKKLSDAMGRKVNVRNYIQEEERSTRQDPARRRRDDEVMERYRF